MPQNKVRKWANCVTLRYGPVICHTEHSEVVSNDRKTKLTQIPPCGLHVLWQVVAVCWVAISVEEGHYCWGLKVGRFAQAVMVLTSDVLNLSFNLNTLYRNRYLFAVLWYLQANAGIDPQLCYYRLSAHSLYLTI